MYVTPERRLRAGDSSFIASSRNVTFQITDDCCLKCSYCVSGDTQIMMADYTTKDIKDVQVGDKVVGFDEKTNCQKQTKVHEAEVLNVFHRKAHVLRVTTESGEELFITPNHKVLVRRNSWADGKCDFVEIGKLSVGRSLYHNHIYWESLASMEYDFKEDDDYKKGYLVGVLKGDGSCKHYSRKSDGCDVFKFRLAVKDAEIIERSKSYLDYFGFNTYLKKFKISKRYSIVENAVFSNTRETYNRVQELYTENFGTNNSQSYFRGFLAGIYDAEGHISAGRVIRICNTDNSIINEITRSMDALGISYVVEDNGRTKNKDHKFNVRIANNLDAKESLKFIKMTNPAVSRKRYESFFNYSPLKKTKIASIEPLEEEIDVYNIETTTGTYIANGIAVHNCYQICKGKKKMSKDTARKCVDLLFDMYERNDDEFINHDINAIILDFIGGEPLMAIDIIDYVCTYFYEKCIELNHPWAYTWRASMTSNGELYFDPAVQAFLKKFRGRVSFSITLDGPKEIHDACRVRHDGTGNFDAAYAAMKHFNANYYEELGTKVTIAPENMANINKIVRFFVDEGMKLIHANCIYEEEWTVEQAQVFYRELKKMADYLLELNDETSIALFEEDFFAPMDETDTNTWCGGTGKMLAFDPDGLAYPCLRYMPSSLGDSVPPLIIGDCDKGLFYTQEQRNIQDELCAVTRRSQNTDECYYCPIAKGCAECAGYSYQQHGCIGKRSTNICNMHKARSLANVYYWNKYYSINGIDKKMPMHLPKEEALKFIDQAEYDMLLGLIGR